MSQNTAPANATPEQQETASFVKTVLADTEDTWKQVFIQQGAQYTPPQLVMFSGAVQSGCGTAESAMGPFYCPADQKVYIDTQFFKDMRQQMGISGEKTNLSYLHKMKQVISHKLM